jgi:acetyl esterase
MPLDPFYAALRADGSVANHSDGTIQHRLDQTTKTPTKWKHEAISVTNQAVAGPHGQVPVRVYRPAGDPTAALLWAHGGGFGAGDLEMPEAHVVSGELALRANALVVSVDYRLAGNGVRYPIPLDDVCAAWEWMCSEQLLGSPELLSGAGQIPAAVGGASAGAALALACALRARDAEPQVRPADAVILAYPFAHFPNPALDGATRDEMAQLSPDVHFPWQTIEYMVRNYVGRISGLPPEAMPGAARLDGLPPVRIALCEYDDLRPSGELLARQLREVGVPVLTDLARGVLHGHLNLTVGLPQIQQTLNFLAAGLR